MDSEGRGSGKRWGRAGKRGGVEMRKEKGEDMVGLGLGAEREG